MKSEAKSPFLIAMTLALVDMLALLLVSALAAGRPKRGGILTFVVASEPPIYDDQPRPPLERFIRSLFSTLLRDFEAFMSGNH